MKPSQQRKTQHWPRQLSLRKEEILDRPQGIKWTWRLPILHLSRKERIVGTPGSIWTWFYTQLGTLECCIHYFRINILLWINIIYLVVCVINSRTLAKRTPAGSQNFSWDHRELKSLSKLFVYLRIFLFMIVKGMGRGKKDKRVIKSNDMEYNWWPDRWW